MIIGFSILVALDILFNIWSLISNVKLSKELEELTKQMDMFKKEINE